MVLKSRSTVPLLAVSASMLLIVAASGQKIRVSTESVPVYVTVTDAQKRLVPGLVREDFAIFDNGRPQAITVFESRTTPITAVVMLDTSGSMTMNLDLVKNAAEQFLIRLLPDDQARVGAFNDKIEFHPESSFTSDRDALIASLRELDFGYPTRLYDAIDESIARLEPIDGRKVVVVFTDGEDTASRVGRGDVMDRAREKGVMVYAIGLESDYFNGAQRVRTRPDRGLKKLAEESGGGYFELKKTDELNATFSRVAEELHSQYVLGFTPPEQDGKVHELEVRVTKAGMTARARKSYVAARASEQMQ